MLSVVIPALNEEKYLPLLLDSLKRQKYQDFEMIVADAKSNDKTREIALENGCHVIEGGLPACGRNNGARKVSGDWILFLDADVVLPPEFLIKAMAEIKGRKLDIASALINPLSDKKIDKVFHRAYNAYAVMTRSFYPHAPGFCIFIRKKIHDQIGGFNELIKLAEDHDYILRASHVGKFGLLKTVRVPVSVRRFDRDGHVNIAMKYLACEAHRIFLGPVEKNFFHYQFGHYQENEKNKHAKK